MKRGPHTSKGSKQHFLHVSEPTGNSFVFPVAAAAGLFVVRLFVCLYGLVSVSLTGLELATWSWLASNMKIPLPQPRSC